MTVLEQAMLKAMKNAERRKNFTAIGADPANLTGAQYRKALVEGYEIMGKSINAANLPRVN